MPLLLDALRHVRPASLQTLLMTAAGLNTRRTVTYEGLTFWIDPTNQIGACVMAREYEESLQSVLKTYLPEGGTFLDIGANEGLFSVYGSKLVGPSGRVVAVEPQSRLQPVLIENLNLNHVTNCQIVQGVVSGETGTAVMILTPGVNAGASGLLRMTRDRVATETVPAWTLADALREFRLLQVDVAKIDVEGAEYDIILSSRDVLASHAIKVYALEYHPAILEKHGLSMDRIHEMFLATGYFLDESHGCSIYRLTQ